jgi:hypothetical protein
MDDVERLPDADSSYITLVRWSQEEWLPVELPHDFKIGMSPRAKRFRAMAPAEQGVRPLMSLNFDGPARVELVSTDCNLRGVACLEHAYKLLSERLPVHPKLSHIKVEPVVRHSVERPDSRRVSIKWGRPQPGEKRFITSVYLLQLMLQVMVEVHSLFGQSRAAA